MLAQASPASWAASAALLIGALAAAYATVAGTRRAAQSAPAAPAPPPPAKDDDDDELVARMWVEMLTRSDEAVAERDEWRARFDECDRERLDLLRRLARGDAP